MHICYIHQHFCTNEGSGGTRSYDVARHMVGMGHRVTIIGGITDVSGFDKVVKWWQLFHRMEIGGINVIFCNAKYSNHMGKVSRMFSFWWFAFLATIAGILFVRKPDVIFATSTPLTVAIPGHFLAKLKHRPFVFEVRDIWPESFIRSGWVTGKEFHIRVMAWLEKWAYKRAKRILLVSKGFEDRLIERGFPPEKLQTILLGADGELFENVTPDESFLDQYGLRGKTIAIYTGAHGKANGLDYIIDAAKKAQGDPKIAFVLIGAGSEKKPLQELAKKKGLSNVVFADAVPKQKLPGILGVCDFGLMILKDIGEPRPVTPNKIFDYMFMRLPALVNFEGPTWDIVKSIDAGRFVSPKKPEELAETLKTLANDPALCKQLGDNARKVALSCFDRKGIARELLDVFAEVIDKSHTGKESRGKTS